MPLAALPFFRLGNYIEAGFWVVVSVAFLIGASRQSGIIRRRCHIAAITFFLFGMSDVVEAQTGAWYRPVGLLIWKAACLVVIAWLLLDYLRRRKQSAKRD